MNPSAWSLAAAAVGLLLNTIALFTIAWRGGRLVERVEGNMKHMEEGLSRVVVQLDAVELRTSRNDIEIMRIATLIGGGERRAEPRD